MQENQESQEWLELAQAIVSHSESSQGDEARRVTIPMQILEKNAGLLNLELSESKIAEIKDALHEYKRLKQIEDQKQSAQYERTRKRVRPIQTGPATVQPRRKAVFNRNTKNKAQINQSKESKYIRTSDEDSSPDRELQALSPQRTIQIFQRYDNKDHPVADSIEKTEPTDRSKKLGLNEDLLDKNASRLRQFN